MKKVWILGAMMALQVACAFPSRASLVPGASGIKVTQQAAGCTEIGEVSGSACAGSLEEALEGAKNAIRNQAFALSADTVRLETNNSTRCSGWMYAGTKVLLTGKAVKCS